MTQAYTLSKENNNIVIKVNQNLLSEEKLTKLLDYLTLENIRNISQLSQEQADKLADEIDQNIWKSLKNRILGEE